MARSVALGFVCFFLLSASPALADRREADTAASTERIIDLTDGSMYRGDLIEYVPKDHLTLRLPTGEIRAFPWGRVKRVAVVASAGKVIPPTRREPKSTAAAPIPADPPAPLPPPPVVSGPAQSSSAVPSYDPQSESEEDGAAPVALPAKLRYEDQLKFATEQWRQKDYKAALESYQRIHQTYNDTRSLYPLAKAQQKLGQFYDAHLNYRRYLYEDASLSPEKRELIQDKAEGALLRHKTFSDLPPSLKKSADLFSFVEMETNNSAARLQFISETLDFDGWEQWASLVGVSPDRYSTICKNECNSLVYRRATLRIAGPGIVPSADFSLPQSSRDVRLTVKAGSKTRRAAAWGFLIAGSVITLAGIGVGGAIPTDNGYNFSQREIQSAAMLGLLGSGAVVMLASIPLFLTSKTRIVAD